MAGEKAQFSHAASGGDWEDVELSVALHMVETKKWRECFDCRYDDGIRNFHCLPVCAVCDDPEDC